MPTTSPERPRMENELPPAAAAPESFAETALRLGGKTDEEVRRTGAVDTADDQVESLYSSQYSTSNSPIHRAIWERTFPVELFQGQPFNPSPDSARVMEASLDVVRRHRLAETLLDDKDKISDQVLDELGTAGYWGLLVDKQYGGTQTPFSQFAPFLTQMAQLDPTVAGLASVHGCIGAVDPLQTFGNAEQKQRFLPKLASGERLSAFALTEPNAGSDLTALRTRAERQGNEYVVYGEKLFITNVVPGRTIGLVCMIEGKPAVLIVDLPPQENDQFRLTAYGLYALKHAYNQGIIFNGLRVPAENLLEPNVGDGLTIAYHGLNRGRVSLCANGAGVMRLMIANMIPWAKFRRTYGGAIATRELVRRRLGHLAGMAVVCDALVEWCASLLDQGFRGEMECIVAKIFGSELQKEAAIDLFMKTHGGRSFLHGHIFGDNIHDFLAPCIYEGEGEMLGMAFFKSLVKHHAKQFFEPIGRTLAGAGIKQPNMLNPAHLWALKGPLWKYSNWLAARKTIGTTRPTMPALPPNLKKHAEFAADFLQSSSVEISGTMRKHQLKLADRQCRMAELSDRIQTATVILCTSLYAGRKDNDIIRTAADCICEALTNKLRGERPSDRYLRKVTKLGGDIAEGGFECMALVAPIMMPYEND